MSATTHPNPVFVAVDTDSTETAKALCHGLKGTIGGIKLGKQFFMAEGPAGVKAVMPRDLPLFLDLKLHDIPNTVAGAVSSVASRVAPAFLTIHASGGAAMVAAAREAADRFGADRPRLLAVTVLTSLGDDDLVAMGVPNGAAAQVLRLARLAIANGADGIVCSPQEVAMLRRELGPEPLLVIPGIRPAGSDVGDQKRVMTPAEAMAAGASRLVIGRPITGAADPAAAALAIAREVGAA
ncbi:MAG: orotidine-5'-phosphate decarboxylase [Pseudomonadota bacterium]|nr:orotidine-5'-phosphate decarboxylase [Pseudomonadota bacterium]